jgi:hypothetical protein
VYDCLSFATFFANLSTFYNALFHCMCAKLLGVSSIAVILGVGGHSGEVCVRSPVTESVPIPVHPVGTCFSSLLL